MPIGAGTEVAFSVKILNKEEQHYRQEQPDHEPFELAAAAPGRGPLEANASAQQRTDTYDNSHNGFRRQNKDASAFDVSLASTAKLNFG
jgi:hypothetical protein